MSKPSYFGIGIENVKRTQNIGTLSSFIFIIGNRYKHQSSDTVKAFNHIPLFRYETINELVLPYSCPLVGIEILDSATNLQDFNHPKQACYLLGAEDHGLSKGALEKCHYLVRFESKFCMNVSCAGSIVMWDRYCKSNKSNLV